jgi:hypothetical protein
MRRVKQRRVYVKDEQQARDISSKIRSAPWAGWIVKGSRAKANQTIELPRDLAEELADKAGYYYSVLNQLPFDPLCHCEEIRELMQKAIKELPAGETAEKLRDVSFCYCPACGGKYDETKV